MRKSKRHFKFAFLFEKGTHHMAEHVDSPFRERDSLIKAPA